MLSKILVSPSFFWGLGLNQTCLNFFRNPKRHDFRFELTLRTMTGIDFFDVIGQFLSGEKRYDIISKGTICSRSHLDTLFDKDVETRNLRVATALVIKLFIKTWIGCVTY